MVGKAIPQDGVAYAAADWRKAQAALMLNGTPDAFSARPGRRPGGGMSASLSGLTWTVTAGAWIGSPDFTSGQGGYLCEFPTNETGSINAQQANPRVDTLYVIVDDNNVDASGQKQARLVYLPGSPAASPVPASIPARGELFVYIDVPATGGGPPSIRAQAQYAAAAGGVLPVASLAEANTLTRSEGQYFDAADADRLLRDNGSTVDASIKVRQYLSQNAIGSGAILVHGTVAPIASQSITLPAPAIIRVSSQIYGRHGVGTVAGFMQIVDLTGGGTVVLNGNGGAGRRFNTHTVSETEGQIWAWTEAMFNAPAGTHLYGLQVATDAGSIDWDLFDTAFDVWEFG
jgi:hypothetical protein